MMCSRMLASRGEGPTQNARWSASAIASWTACWPFTEFAYLVPAASLDFAGHLDHLPWPAPLYCSCQVPKSFLPIGDSGFIFGVMIAQEGTSPQQMRHYQDQAEKPSCGPIPRWRQLHRDGLSAFLPPNQGFLLAFLNDRDKRAADRGRDRACSAGKLHAIVNTVVVPAPRSRCCRSAPARPPTTGQFSFAISGVDRQRGLADRHEDDGANAVQYGHPGFAADHAPTVQSTRPTSRSRSCAIRPPRTAFRRPPSKTLLRNAYSQNYVYLIKKPDRSISRSSSKRPTTTAADPADLSLLYVRSDDGLRMVPLSAVAKWKQSSARSRSTTSISSPVRDHLLQPHAGVPLGAATEFIDKTAATDRSPAIRGNFQGEAKDFQETITRLTILMLLAVFVMYVVLGILYESYLHPLTVLSSLPVALVGRTAHALALRRGGSLYAYIGMFMLMGIVKKNGIMIVDFALQRMAQGQTSDRWPSTMPAWTVSVRSS